MASGLDIYQGTNKDITVGHGESALTSATEIEYLIDSTPQIIKKLSAGEISAVSATSMTVAIVPGDTSNVKSGEFDMELRYTLAGKVIPMRVRPSYCRILESAFV